VQGKSAKVAVLAAPDTGASGTTQLAWRSSKAAVASPKRAKATGTFSAKLGKAVSLKIVAAKPGKSTIAITSADGRRATIKVTVVRRAVAVAKARVSPKSKTLRPGATTRLKAKATPATATVAIPRWRSSNTRVAKVDATGQVTAIAAGTTRVTATIGTKTATTTIRVR
jgi:uncharacterized protein YjdB